MSTTETNDPNNFNNINDANGQKLFNATEEAKTLARLYPAHGGRKLTFEQRCQAYACLYHGVPQVMVATAFALSRPSVNALAGCRQDARMPVVMSFHDGEKIRTETLSVPNLTRRRSPDRKPRYQDVAREFDQLGETAFTQTYFTPEIKTRIEAAAHARPRYGVPDPNADQYQGQMTDKWGETFLIDWIDDGWRYIVCRDGKPKDGHDYNGDHKQKPFLTSTAAFYFLRGD